MPESLADAPGIASRRDHNLVREDTRNIMTVVGSSIFRSSHLPLNMLKKKKNYISVETQG
jgi:hypothetical protein